jgi:hypothetical protein
MSLTFLAVPNANMRLFPLGLKQMPGRQLADPKSLNYQDTPLRAKTVEREAMSFSCATPSSSVPIDMSVSNSSAPDSSASGSSASGLSASGSSASSSSVPSSSASGSSASSCNHSPESLSKNPRHPSNPIKTPFCMYDAELDEELRKLHVDLLHGDAKAQVAIDGLLLAASCPDNFVRRAIVTNPSQTLTYETLPDLSQFFCTLFDPQPQTIFLCHLMQQLSPLRRRVRVRRMRALEPGCGVEASVCLTLLQAHLTGLYPRACKLPVFTTRRELVVALHHLKTSPFKTQLHFLSKTSSLLRLAMLEYSLNARLDFAPVEQQHLAACVPHLQQFDNSVVSACDNLRHSCLQSDSDWSWNALDNYATQMVDRVSRLCRATMLTSSSCSTINPTRERIVDALNQHVVHGHSVGSTTEMAISRVHSVIRVFSLPKNMVKREAERVLSLHKENPLLLHNVCCKNMCVACLLQNGNKSFYKRLKLRMDTTTDKLVCATCESQDTMVQVNVFAKLLRVGQSTYFCCSTCASFQVYDPSAPLACSRCATSSKEHKLRQRKRACVFCARVCIGRAFPLLFTAAATEVFVTLCFKHTPPQHAWQHIHDVEALEQYALHTPSTRKKKSWELQ